MCNYGKEYGLVMNKNYALIKVNAQHWYKHIHWYNNSVRDGEGSVRA